MRTSTIFHRWGSEWERGLRGQRGQGRGPRVERGSSGGKGVRGGGGDSGRGIGAERRVVSGEGLGGGRVLREGTDSLSPSSPVSKWSLSHRLRRHIPPPPRPRRVAVSGSAGRKHHPSPAGSSRLRVTRTRLFIAWARGGRGRRAGGQGGGDEGGTHCRPQRRAGEDTESCGLKGLWGPPAALIDECSG